MQIVEKQDIETAVAEWQIKSTDETERDARGFIPSPESWALDRRTSTFTKGLVNRNPWPTAGSPIEHGGANAAEQLRAVGLTNSNRAGAFLDLHVDRDRPGIFWFGQRLWLAVSYRFWLFARPHDGPESRAPWGRRALHIESPERRDTKLIRIKMLRHDADNLIEKHLIGSTGQGMMERAIDMCPRQVVPETCATWWRFGSVPHMQQPMSTFELS